MKKSPVSANVPTVNYQRLVKKMECMFAQIVYLKAKSNLWLMTKIQRNYAFEDK